MGKTSDCYTVKKETVDWTLMILASLIPQPLIAFIVMKVLDGGWPVFWYTILAICSIQFVIWLSNTLVSAVFFRLYLKKRLVETIYNNLVNMKFPTAVALPGKNNSDMYYHDIFIDGDIPCDIRIKAAAFYSEFNSPLIGVLGLLRLHKVHEEALVKYFNNHPGISISSYYEEEE